MHKTREWILPIFLIASADKNSPLAYTRQGALYYLYLICEISINVIGVALFLAELLPIFQAFPQQLGAV